MTWPDPELEDAQGRRGDGHRPPGRQSPGRRSLTERIRAALEAQSERWPLWTPVCLALGIAAYFWLPREPSLYAALAPGVAGIAFVLLTRRGHLAMVASIALLLAGVGVLAAKLQTERMRAPVLERNLGPVEVSGRIERASPRAKGGLRITLKVGSIAGLAPERTPTRVTLTVRAKTTAGEGEPVRARLIPGARVSLRAMLSPPPGPVSPGAFDFARKAWFDGIGATGYAVSRPRLEAPGDTGPYAGLRDAVGRLRLGIAARIEAALGDAPATPIAVALITGERGGLPETTLANLRDAGLAHVLAISGLHMAIMAGAMFWLVRALLALYPPIALCWPVKKVAAFVALVGAVFYLQISGASVATERAFIMIAILFIAVLLERPAFSLRNVAIAATIILLCWPHSLMSPGFQMSFAAATALVAAYEALSERRRLRPERWAGPIGWPGRVALYLGGIALTTLIAGLATAPFAAFHFNRVADYSLITNLLAMPLVGIVIMPMALATLVAMPFGLEALPIAVMAVGIDAMVAVAAEIASWPGSVLRAPQMPVAAIVALTVGGLWLCLWTGQRRWAGLLFVATGLALIGPDAPADLLIERDGKVIAYRTEDGALAFPMPPGRNYSAAQWLRGNGQLEASPTTAGAGVFRCDRLGCAGHYKGKWIALALSGAALEDDCRRADVLILRFRLRRPCASPRVVIDGRALKAGGAHAVYLEEGTIRVRSATEARGARPWSHRSARPAGTRSNRRPAP